MRVSEYYRLTKPGIVYGNSLHYLAGALFAGLAVWQWQAVVGGLVGQALIIASACVVNNYIDRDIDTKMKRTHTRPSATRSISHARGGVFAAMLGAIGFTLLFVSTNALTVLLGVVAYISYTVLYTYSKRYTRHHTLIGVVPGALPAVAGYTSLTNSFDVVAGLLFIVVALWQLPHFYAIGVYRYKEYRAAGVPLLGDTLAPQTIKRIITALIALYAVSVAVFSFVWLNWLAALILMLLAAWWFTSALLTYSSAADKWARGVFARSLVITLCLPIVAVVKFLTA